MPTYPFIDAPTAGKLLAPFAGLRIPNDVCLANQAEEKFTGLFDRSFFRERNNKRLILYLLVA